MNHDPTAAEAELLRAIASAREGRMDEARAAALRCIALSPGRAEALELLDWLEGAASTIWQPGAVLLDSYEVVRQLGRGAMGVVHLVRHRMVGTELAVKLAIAGGDRADALEREAETWISLPLHPHVVRCCYVRRVDGAPAIFMEHVAGGSLTSVAARWGTGPQRLARALDAAIQSAWGLGHAHRAGLVHQDFKPDNVLVEPDGTAKVSDFGIARAVTTGALATVVGGTPAYASPEQGAALHGGGASRVSAASDVWSWAVAFVELLAGARIAPLGAATAQAFERRLSAGDGSFAAGPVPPTLVALLRACFAVSPDQRPTIERAAATLLELAGPRYPRRAPASTVESHADDAANRALSFLELGQIERAREAWRDALSADPLHPEATLDEGLFRWRRGELTDVEFLAKLAPVVQRQGVEAHTRRAYQQVLGERGETEPSRREWFVGADSRSEGLHEATPDVVWLSEDAAHAVSATWGKPADVRAWRPAVGRASARKLVGHDADVVSIAGSGVAGRVLTGAKDGSVVMWDLQRAAAIARHAGTGHPVWRLACADTRVAIAVDDTGFVRILDLATGVIRGTHQVPLAGPLGPVDLSPDGRAVVVAHGEAVTIGPRTIDVGAGRVIGARISGDVVLVATQTSLSTWSLSSGTPIRRVSVRLELTEPEIALTSPTTAVIATAHTIQWWELDTGRCRRTWSAHVAHHAAPHLTRDGTLMLTSTRPQEAIGSNDHCLVLVGIPTPSTHSAAYSVAPVRSRPEIARAGELHALIDDAAACIDRGDSAGGLTRLREARALPGAERNPRLFAAWSSLYSSRRRTVLRAVWPAAKLADAQDPLGDFVCAGPNLVCGLTEYGLARQALVMFDIHRRAVVWRSEVGAMVFHVRTAPNAPWVMTDAHDDSGRTQVWATSTGRLLAVHADDHWLPISPDLALVTGYRAGPELRSVVDGSCTAKLKGRPDVWDCAAASRDLQTIATGGKGGELWIWDLARYAPRHQCKDPYAWHAHHDSVTSVAFTVDGQHVIAASDDKTLGIWSVRTGERERHLKGHAAYVRHLALSDDGRLIASADTEPSVRLWSGETDETLFNLVGTSGPLALTSDGKHLLTRTDGAIQIWNLDWDLV